ncbi:MAG: hypothetical protein ACREM2_06000 [Vulcanimicrobiaceae bacterium]
MDTLLAPIEPSAAGTLARTIVLRSGDEALLVESGNGGSAGLSVRTAELSLSFALPSGPYVREDLLALAELVLARVP